MTRDDQQTYEVLLMKAIDGLLNETEHATLQQLLDADPARRAEYHDLLNIKEDTDMLTQRILGDANLYTPGIQRIERCVIQLATALMFVGITLISVYGGKVLLTAPDIPPLVRWGGLLSGIAALLFLGLAVAGRLRGGHRDPYLEIDQ